MNVIPERVLQVSVSPAQASLTINAGTVYTATLKTTCGDFPAAVGV